MQVRSFPFETVIGIGPQRIVAADIDGLGRLLTRRVIHRERVADGIARKRISSAGPDLLVV